MKTIGLIGGMSWESTAVYYRRINESVRKVRGGLHSAEIALRSLDFNRVVELQKAGRWDDAGTLLGEAGAGLARAGAECVLICTNTMHLVSEPVARLSGVQLIDIIDETAAALKADGRTKPLLLATRYTMEHGFYAERMARHGIEVIVPDCDARGTVHDIIFDELCQGLVEDASRERYLDIIEKSRAQGVDSVILGCTEISLLVDPDSLPLPGYDSTAIHADAAVRFALGEAMDKAA
ncbi:MAG: aspartate/glutamate racemase family protein [Devosia sp.]|uniref:aspartate/glutamate racemase family protein n=1 Tax=unclassified Devosia TaxID=196773 RepID=UPI0019E1C1C7|nr:MULTISPECIES: aspartate/glutamate racemase family protein [unclassified Devosia]MBF0680395.1 aspartate/glutamate racemase family protein [Devosia sp.]WEJ32903.1 aspartate/glutamate racemase family protein [Devosia sp. SD17-2]